jgi:hypothetical protein
MTKKKRGIDEDYVTPETYKKSRRKAPPEPWELPSFEPLQNLKGQEPGKPVLPSNIDSTAPEEVFDFLFDSECIDLIVRATNRNAASNPPQKGPRWRDLTVYELHGWIGVHLYASCFKARQLDYLWNIGQEQGPLFYTVRNCISRDRFRQINRYIHVSDEPQEVLREQTPFQKIAKLSAILQVNSAGSWAPGRHVAVDECIQRFTGRSNATVNIPSKPTPTGYKIWVLAEHGYVIDWLYHRKGNNYGPINLDTRWLKQGFTKTEAVPLTLVSHVSEKLRGSVVYLDNLFTSTRLCRELRGLGVGACGTVRMSKTAREEYDESHIQEVEDTQGDASQRVYALPSTPEASQLSQTSQTSFPFGLLRHPEVVIEFPASQIELEAGRNNVVPARVQNFSQCTIAGAISEATASILPTPLASQPQGQNTRERCQEQGNDETDWPGVRGVSPVLVSLKKEHNSSTPWGALYACLSKCENVLQIAWKDQQLVMMMSTVHRGNEMIERLRKKPAKGSAGHATAQKVFGDSWTKSLPIPRFIDDYNHHMNAVDLADQLRSSYNASRRCRRTWKPLFYFVVD